MRWGWANRERILCAMTCYLAVACFLSVPSAQAAEFRGFWADVWHVGFKSISDIDNMVNRAVQGNYNAIVAQVLPYHDNASSSHGAYWNSIIVGKAPDIVGGIDPLAELCTRAHAQGIEVHPWIMPYRISLSWPPAGNSTLSDPDHWKWVMVKRDHIGGGPATIDGIYNLDPGSPDVQEYLISIVRELVTNYDVDGIHFDRIRYTQTPGSGTDGGYPSDTSYTRSGLARFKAITGYSGTPAVDYGPWEDFRRRGITELVRRVRAEIPTITTNPRQPVRLSAALVTWGNAPSSFQSSSAYAVFQNWEEWTRLGYLDTAIPMTYYDEDTYPTYYRNWVGKAAVTWDYDRHMVIGPGIYLNEFADSITQMQYARTKGADGLCTYSYYETVSSGNDWTWYTYVSNNLFTSPVSTPAMTWRDPATATEGTIWGRITDDSTGDPVDNATVQVSGQSAVQADGNGYYVVTLIPELSGGTSYSMTVTKSGLPSGSHPGAIVYAGDLVRYDFSLGAGPPAIQVSPSLIERSVIRGNNLPEDTFDVRNSEDGALNYTNNVGAGASWLNISPRQDTSGGEWDTITITYDTVDLTFGNYSATITVEDAAATNSPQTTDVLVHVIFDHIPGDFDDDDDIDLADFGVFQACLDAGGQGPPAVDCEDADLDGDHNVDIDDLNKFLGCMSGAGIPGEPTCAD